MPWIITIALLVPSFVMSVIILLIYRPVSLFGLDTIRYGVDTPIAFMLLAGTCGALLGYKLHRQSLADKGLGFLESRFQKKTEDTPSASDDPVLPRNTKKAMWQDVFAFAGLILFLMTGMVGLNGALDTSSARTVSGVVMQKHTSTHKGQRSYTLDYAIPSERDGGMHYGSLRVSLETYQKAKTNVTPVAVSIKEGFLGLNWISAARLNLPSSGKQGLQDPVGTEAASRAEFISAMEWQVPADRNVYDSVSDVIEEKWPDGSKKSEEPTLDGERHGAARYWWPNGQKYAEIHWSGGQKNGRFKLYREDGSLEQNLSYKNGQPHGLCCWYDEKGNMTHRQVYIDGQEVKYPGVILPVCP